MKISIIHPSRSRPTQAAATAKAWLSSAKWPELIEYLLSMDVDDKTNYDYCQSISNIEHDIKIVVGVNKSAIEAINKAAEISTGDLIIAVSDDFNTPPFHWDEALRSHLKGKSDYLVKTEDGAQPWLITLPILDRKYYERYKYIYPPHIIHMFADTWMTTVGEMLGKIIKLPLKIPHNHYTTGKINKDAVNDKNNKTWEDGEAKYLEGVMNNFGLHDGEIDFSFIKRVHPSHIAWLKTKGISYEKVQ